MKENLKLQDFILWDKMIKNRAPLSFNLGITARCNLNCRHCYINLPAGNREAMAKELTVTDIIGIARQAVEMGTVWCLITGGEPLLRPDFPDIYMGLKRLGLLVSVFTNATMVSDDLIKMFSKYPPRDIEVTVYGIDEATYEAVTRQKGSFNKFKIGLEKLRISGVNVRLKAMAIRSNFHQQKAIADFCQARTKDYFRFDPLLHLRFDGDPLRNEEIRSERLTPEQIVTLEQADKARINYLCSNCDVLINEEFTRSRDDHLICCGAGNGSFDISYDGLFRLCTSLCAESTNYDLRTGTLREAWFDFVPAVLDMRSGRKEFLDTCSKCALVNLCFWCPAHAYLETGELDGFIPYFCEVAHKRAESIRSALK